LKIPFFRAKILQGKSFRISVFKKGWEPAMGGKVFATAINCIDGRAQEQVISLIKESTGADYVDMITLAGPDKVLAQGVDAPEIESIKKNVLISRDKHNSRTIFITGHYDCAGNPVDQEKHIQDIGKAAENIKGWDMGLKVEGIWVDRNWRASLLNL